MKELEICERLRALDEKIIKQRRLVGGLKGQGVEMVAERQRLADLLTELDALLKASAVGRAA